MAGAYLFRLLGQAFGPGEGVGPVLEGDIDRRVDVDRPVLVPPHPELLGAQGVALLALQRAGADRDTDLETLSEAEIEKRGSFVCQACGLHCNIDRLEVAAFSARSLILGRSLGDMQPIGDQQVEALRRKFFPS